MGVRRVVTGHDDTGQAVVASDEIVDGLELMAAPGVVFTRLFGADEIPAIPAPTDPSGETHFPPPGGFRMMLFTTPPDSRGAPPDLPTQDATEAMRLAFKEAEEKAPGLLATVDLADMPFHASPTIDLIFVVSGRLLLDLGGGRSTELGPGDVVIQNGTRHAWRNPGDEIAVAIGVSLGASAPG